MKLDTDQPQNHRLAETPEERARRIHRLIERARKYRKKFPRGFKFNRYEANER